MVINGRTLGTLDIDWIVILQHLSTIGQSSYPDVQYALVYCLFYGISYVKLYTSLMYSVQDCRRRPASLFVKFLCSRREPTSSQTLIIL